MKTTDSYKISSINKSINILPVFHRNERSEQQAQIMKMARLTAYSGKLQGPGRHKIEKIIDTWYKINERYNDLYGKSSIRHEKRFVMITLTLPSTQMHYDKHLKQTALRYFLNCLRDKEGIKNYIWKAEAQQNKNIHFHVVIDEFVPYERLYNYWNDQMILLGYNSKFYEKYPDSRPPHTNVKGQKQMNNPVSYITKYMEKKETSRPIDGAVWRANNNLANLKPFTLEIDNNDLTDLIQTVENQIYTSYDNDYFQVIMTAKRFKITDIFIQYRAEENEYYDRLYECLRKSVDPRQVVIDDIISDIARKKFEKETKRPPAPEIPSIYDSLSPHEAQSIRSIVLSRAHFVD